MKRRSHRSRHPNRSRWLDDAIIAGIGFLGGTLTTLLLVTPIGSDAERRSTTDVAMADVPRSQVSPDVERTAEVRPAAQAAEPPRIGASPIADLRARGLRVPVAGIDPKALRSSFDESRGESRRHEAMDILAPRHTPVVAVEDGRIAKLFHSEAGGIAVYQFDPSATYVYYYAHLERYARGLDEGDPVRAGDVIGYVGTSGNAPSDTPHLHFAIFRLTDEKRWWDGSPIDPFLVFDPPM